MYVRALMVKNRVFGLDIVRCIAILTVVIGHIFYVVPNSNVNPKAVRLIFFDGVDIFFTLSGYLIGGILLRQLEAKPPTLSNLLKFLKNRWWRTLPAYLVVLVCLIAVALIHKQIGWKSIVPYFFFLQNLKTGQMPVFTESWSLAVEEWFYLTTPLMLFILCRVIPLKKAIPFLIVCVFLLANAIRVFKIYHYGPYSYSAFENEILKTVPTRIDAVMFGVLGAYLRFYRFRVWRNHRNLFFWIGLVGFLANHFYGATCEWPNIYLLFFQKQVELLFVLMTLPKMSSIKVGHGRVARVITFISLASYSIYIIHGSMFIKFISPLFPKYFWLQLPIFLIWSFGGAYIMYRTVEQWGLRQRDQVRAKGESISA